MQCLRKTVIKTVVTCAVLLASSVAVVAQEVKPLEIFEQRIMPIFNSPNPSSCVQCHLSNVDLKDYILPDSRATFVALRKQGLVNIENPADSKILQLIQMGELDGDRLAKRIHEKNRVAEYEAFSAWIHACANDPELVAADAQVAEEAVGPRVDDRVVRHTRKDRVLDSFVRNIWSQRMRCFPCHTPSEIDSQNPQHETPAKRHGELVEKFGQRMNIFKETPEATLKHLVNSSRRPHGNDFPLINLSNPADSLLVLKPISRLPAKGLDGKPGQPSSATPVSHMGGIKMHKNDFSYKAFVSWLTDYAKSVNGDYAEVADLPSDNWQPTQHIVRIKQLPEDWIAMHPVQIFVHAWDNEADEYSAQATAFTQSLLTPRRIVNGALFLLDNGSGETRPLELAAGKFQLRAFWDREQQIEQNPTMMLNTREADLVVDVEVEQWGVGFKNALVVEPN